MQCQVCGRWLRGITGPHLRTHDLDAEQYRERYGLVFLFSDEVRRKISDANGKRSDGRYEPLDREEIIAGLREWAERSPPLTWERVNAHEPGLAAPAAHLFGSWEAAVEAAGIRPEHLPHWSKEKIVAAIRERRRTGESLYRDDVRWQAPSLYHAVSAYYGNAWGIACRDAGIDYAAFKGRRRRAERAAFADEMRAFGADAGGVLRPSDLSKAVASDLTRQFGSIEAAAQELGLRYETKSHAVPRIWTDEAMVDAIRAIVAAGRSLSPSELKKTPDDMRVLSAGVKRFGTWRAAVRAAGIDYAEHRRKRANRSEAEIAAALRQWVAEHGPLGMRELEATDRSLLYATHRRWGSIEAAARALDLPLARPARRWSPERIIALIEERHRAGAPVSYAAVSRCAPDLVEAARRLLGSWRAAVEAAGIDYADVFRRPPGRRPSAPRDRDPQSTRKIAMGRMARAPEAPWRLPDPASPPS